MVPDYEAQEANVKRFVGRIYNKETQEWVMKDKPTEVPDRAEYRQAILEGDLLPANEETEHLFNMCGRDCTKHFEVKQ